MPLRNVDKACGFGSWQGRFGTEFTFGGHIHGAARKTQNEVGLGIVDESELCWSSARWPANDGPEQKADGPRSGGSDPGACWNTVAKGDSRHFQGWRSGHAGGGNRGDYDGDDGRAATSGGERSEPGDHTRADFLQPPGRAGRHD